MKRVGLGLWRKCENLYIQVPSIFHNFPLNDSIVTIPCCYSRSLTVHIKSSPVLFERFGATEAVDLAIFNGWCCESLWLNRKSGPGSFWVGNRRQHGWKSLQKRDPEEILCWLKLLGDLHKDFPSELAKLAKVFTTRVEWKGPLLQVCTPSSHWNVYSYVCITYI